jgi:hypothetical protein
MSGISTGTALVIGAGLTAGTAIYSADKGKDQARRMRVQEMEATTYYAFVFGK